MNYNPQLHHRRSIRLRDYNYSQTGAYFVTLCTYQKQCLLGDVVDGTMQLNQFGEIVAEEWQKSSQIRQEIALDRWVIMPNHIHGIVMIHAPTDIRKNDQRINSTTSRMKPRSLSSFITGFKSATTKRVNQIRDTPRTPFWQRNYYDRIIRDESALSDIRQYIINNPLNWLVDPEYPQSGIVGTNGFNIM
jgi:REP element-mobilizing transposase RayT